MEQVGPQNITCYAVFSRRPFFTQSIYKNGILMLGQSDIEQVLDTLIGEMTVQGADRGLLHTHH